MPIKGAQLLSGATISATGGTAKTFTELGETIKNGCKVGDLSVTDSRIRPTIVCINRPAAMSLGKYTSKDKRTIKLVQPKLLADGTLAYNVREIRSEDHPESTDAEKNILDGYAAQLMFDGDFTQFRLYGTTA